jgi:NADH-quinone oxidoreductase subunit M
MPFISTVFVIAGFASLGLPGLSGFVAEMTIFMGGWQNPDTIYRIATILACASIVVTAVYILRAAGRTVMGPISDSYVKLTDATWNEKLAAGLLIAGILLIGIAPFLINQLINPGTENIMQQLGKAILP